MKRVALISLIAVLAVVACRPFEKLPEEPYIEFRSFRLFDTIDILGNTFKAGVLSFYFEDGDGDVGMFIPVDSVIDETNIFLNGYLKSDGVFRLINEGEFLYPSGYRIPFIEREGQNKILRGVIDVTLTYLLFSPADTLYYDFWITDRKGNSSNTATTCEIVLGQNGTCSQSSD